MAKLTKLQPDTLLRIVMYANQHGGKLPTGREFACLITGKENSDLSATDIRSATYKIKRLQDGHPKIFTNKGKNGRQINYAFLITEADTARVLLNAHRNLTTDDYILERDFVKIIIGNNQNASELIESLINAHYIERIHLYKDRIRMGGKFDDHYEYLKLLS